MHAINNSNKKRTLKCESRWAYSIMAPKDSKSSECELKIGNAENRTKMHHFADWANVLMCLIEKF